MKKKLILYTLVLTSISYSWSQNTSLDNSILVRNNVGGIGTLLNFSRTLPLPPVDDEGSVFLLDKFSNGFVSINNLGEPIAVERLNYNLELKSAVLLDERGQMRMIPRKIIHWFSVNKLNADSTVFWNSSSYNEYKVDNVMTGDGLLQLASDLENASLFIKWDLEVIQPSYNPAVNVGNRARQLNRKKQYVLGYGKKLYFDFKLKKKMLTYIFETKADLVISYVKENNIKSNVKDLKKLIAFLNTI